MSEQAKIAALQEKTREAARLTTTGFIFFGFGILGLMMSILTYELISQSILFVAAILSAIVAVVGIVLAFHYNSMKGKLMKELESLAYKTPVCPRCGKKLPQGDLAFCPFCSYPLLLTHNPS